MRKEFMSFIRSGRHVGTSVAVADWLESDARAPQSETQTRSGLTVDAAPPNGRLTVMSSLDKVVEPRACRSGMVDRPRCAPIHWLACFLLEPTAP